MRIAVAAVCLVVPSQLFAQSTSIERVRWLAGCWEINSATRRTVERWSAPMNGQMTGSSRTIVNGNVREAERLRLFFQGDTLVYEAIPSGQALTLFKAPTFTDREIVFENPAHDFPQRIVYTRVGADSLVARIEGDRAGRRQPVTYPFRKAECGPDQRTPGEMAREALAPLYKDLNDREAAGFGGSSAWAAAHAADGYQLVAWVAPGSNAIAINKEQAARTAELQRTSAGNQTLRDPVYAATVEKVHVVGDTIEALVITRRTYKFPDALGRLGPAGAYHERSNEERRVDRWIRVGGELKLKQISVVSDEARVDGKPVTRSGVPVPPG